MLELTNEQCFELQRRTEAKLQEMFAEQDGKEIQLAACKMVIPAIICTLREYDRIKQTETSD